MGICHLIHCGQDFIQCMKYFGQFHEEYGVQNQLAKPFLIKERCHEFREEKLCISSLLRL